MKRRTPPGEKPYNKCLPCQHRIEKRCDGPRTSAMTLERWCEFMRDMKEANGLTNADVAERSGVSIKTIERIMAQNCEQDIRRETARLIEDAIIGSSNQYPCYLAFEESVPQESERLAEALREMERLAGDNEEYKKIQDNIHTSYNKELQDVRDDSQRKIDFLRSQLDRLQRENDNLWAENNRKSKVIDMFLEKQNVLLTPQRDM